MQQSQDVLLTLYLILNALGSLNEEIQKIKISMNKQNFN